jgi:hypothetical protein
VDFVLSLIEAYPEAASFKKNGWTALHFACFRGFSLAIVHRLYRLDPEAVIVQDYLNDFLSIKLANQHTHRWKSLNSLSKKHPESAQSRNSWWITTSLCCSACTFHWKSLKC